MAERAGAADGPSGWMSSSRREVFPVVPWAPRVVVRADLVSAFGVLSIVGVLGIALGWMWSRLAPTQRMRVITDDGRAVPLQWESWHRFDGLALFVLLGLAAGVLTGVAVWQLRARRGPVVLVGAVAGSALAAWLATRLGPAFAEAAHPVPASPAVGSVVEYAPVLESAWVVVAQPFATALLYGVCAAWNARDDLGRRWDRAGG